MAEYIEREAVNALIEAECSPKVAAFLNHAIDNIPAADVRPVVTCSDCKWWTKQESSEDLAFKPPVHAIRVKTCGNDWVTDCDATLTADKVRGFALDSEGVKVYSRERDIHGEYDNIYVPYSNLEALIFYFNELLKEE